MTGPPTPRQRAGFTVVELLTVLSIIAVLAAFLLPVLSAAMNSTRRAVCLSNLHQLGQATLSYSSDWDLLPNVPAPATPEAGGLLSLVGAEFPYLNRWPSASSSTLFRLTLTRGRQELPSGLFRCPNDSGAPAFDFFSSVYDSSGTSYLWDPAAAADIIGVAGLVSVNGKSLDELKDSSRARLLQDYGATWHREGRSTGLSLLTAAKVNVVFADGHTGQADVLQPNISMVDYNRIVQSQREGATVLASRLRK